jgi:transcription elongation factor Elf1
MKCPHCGDRTAVDLDTHSSGFTSDESPVKECGSCGLVWRVKVECGVTKLDIIKQADDKK